MDVAVRVEPNRYLDSISLMMLSQRLQAAPGVTQAMACMGTPLNRSLLESLGLLAGDGAGAGPGDLVVAVGADSRAAAEAALAQVQLTVGGGAAAEAPPPRSIAAALRQAPEAELAFIAVPGPYAALEARRALEHGLNVMLFSGNVPVEQERSLKELAIARGLLLMGPDCGTAILNGVGLGFANAVRRGPISIVAASGTGAQELSVLVDRLGSGIGEIIGTGGRDLSQPVGGLMTLAALERLQADPATGVTILVSKPPAPEVAHRVQQAAARSSKPVILCLLGAPGALSLDEAAVKAVHLATGQGREELRSRLGYGQTVSLPRPATGRTQLRGLFAGGTLCEQARLLLPDHSLLDLGDDRFTRGRPHPMIDPTLRREYLREAAADPQTGVILIDLVLGHGAHPDPAGALLPELSAAVRSSIAVLASVTGTEADPQCRSRQEATLREAGVCVLQTARQAALAAATILRRGGDGL